MAQLIFNKVIENYFPPKYIITLSTLIYEQMEH